MTRRALTTLVLFLAAVAAPARAAGPPAPVPIDHGWELSFDHTSWKPTTVPGVFDADTPPGEYLGMVGWYRVTFTGPPASGYDWALRFESVRRKAEVTLNGVPIGTHSDPYVPFELPAKALRPGQPNVLEVKVDNRKVENPREGWWNWGGIVRPVELVPKGRVALDDAAVLTKSLDGDTATMLFDGWVTNRTTKPLEPEIEVALRAPDGGAPADVQRRVGVLGPGEQRRVQFEFPVEKAQTWAPDHPNLYAERIDTTVDGRLEQRDTREIGIRTVTVANGRLLLNGRPVQLRGASIQEDAAGHGAALTDADMDWIVAKLKALHANVTRAHYLLNDRLLHRLDRAGIMVWSQSPIYHRDSILVTPQERADALATVRGTVLSARVHPAVFTHSVANELSPEPDKDPAVAAYIDAARRLEIDLDPTLPPSIDTLSYPGFPRAETYAKFPLLGINSYFGWYHGKVDHPVGDINGLKTYLQRMQQQYPDSARLVTEFGAEATMNGPATQKQTYAFQADYVKKTLGMIEAAPNISGAIYWTLREFAVKPFWDGGAEISSIRTDAIHNKGLISYDGSFTKPAFAVAAKEFAATPLYLPEPGVEAGPTDVFGWGLTIVVPLGMLAMLLIALWALRDIWRYTRPPEAEIVALPRRHAA